MRHIGRWMLWWMFLAVLPVAGHPGDSLEVSLLTCAPGQKVYELYGHTAIRIQDKSTGNDRVYNYGVFDSRRPHFVWRFILGETDYELGCCDFNRFADAYLWDGRSIDEQKLNLTAEEKLRLAGNLEENARPENREYRYNFLYDNCTTRAIAQIERSLEGKLVFDAAGAAPQTYREIVHEFSDGSPWLRFGQDLLLGSEVDTALSLRGTLFSPVYAEGYLQQAAVVSADGEERPLVAVAQRYVAADIPQEGAFAVGPLAATLWLLAVIVAVSFYEWRRRVTLRGVDYLLMLAQGGTGCIIALLFFCSEHPAVGSNWLVVWLNPLPLLYLPVRIWHEHRGIRDWYNPVATAVLGLFLLASPFLPQSFPVEILLLALTLLIRTTKGTAHMFAPHII